MVGRVFAVNGTVSIRNELFELQFQVVQSVSNRMDDPELFLRTLHDLFSFPMYRENYKMK